MKTKKIIKYCMPVFPGTPFFGVRISSYGLGNLLLIWARAVVYAKDIGAVVVWPSWTQIHLGGWFRGDKDKRTYCGTFYPTRSYTRRCDFRGHLKFEEHELAEFLSEQRSAVVYFRGLGEGFSSLCGHSNFLWRELCSISKTDLNSFRQSAVEYVGFGIRLGDFKTLGWSTPVEWFELRLKELRLMRPHQKVWIFSDGSDDELAGLLKDTLVERAPPCAPIETIAQMSGTRLMIVTGGSSFYRWGVYLGNVPVLACAYDKWQAEIWTYLSSRGVALTSVEKPSLCDWETVLGTK